MSLSQLGVLLCESRPVSRELGYLRARRRWGLPDLKSKYLMVKAILEAGRKR